MVKFCKSKKCLNGKVAIITGANAGIGYETALDFAKRGCRVILACRSKEKAENAKEQIIKITGNEDVVVKTLDLASLESVRSFAEDILKNETRLDLLINNAGAMDLPNEITSDGLQLEMATNYFSHFLLTNLLLDLLKKSAPSRVINVASAVAKFVWNLDLDKLNTFEKEWSLYSRTKLCNIYFTQELAKRLEGTGVTTYSLHPGVIASEFLRERPVINFVFKKFFLSPEEGAQTQIYLSLADDIEEHNGKHFENSEPVKPYCGARDEEKQKQLWEISEKLVGLK